MVPSTIRPVTLDELLGPERYEQIREDLRRRIIALKRNRRLAVGDIVTLVFENHDTMFFQIQEMLRAERISDLDAVRHELQVYNALLPEPGQLAATMLIEITDSSQVESRLNALIGIDEAVRLEVGAHVVRADFEPGRSREDKLSAVQYVRFALPAPVRDSFCDPAVPACIVVDHPNYRIRAAIAGAIRESLIEDVSQAR
jgi:hypothetical protein